MHHEYRANFGDGTWTKSYLDIRDAKRLIWERAGIVQYRSFIEMSTADGWCVVIPSRASKMGPPIGEKVK